MAASASDPPDAADYLALFAQYPGVEGSHDFGRAYLEPDDERYRLLFDQVCRLLVRSSAFNRAMPQEFRRTARAYIDGETSVVTRMRRPELRHFMLSDLYDYVHLCGRMGQAHWC